MAEKRIVPRYFREARAAVRKYYPSLDPAATDQKAWGIAQDYERPGAGGRPRTTSMDAFVAYLAQTGDSPMTSTDIEITGRHLTVIGRDVVRAATETLLREGFPYLTRNGEPVAAIVPVRIVEATLTGPAHLARNDGFRLDEARLADFAGDCTVDDDLDAFLVIETAIQGLGADDPLITGPCQLAIDLLANSSGEPDGYRLLIPHGTHWAASKVQSVTEMTQNEGAALRESLYDPAEILRGAMLIANELLTGPHFRDCALCGDIDQPEYQHRTTDHPDAVANAQNALYDQILAAVPAGLREQAEGWLTDLLCLTDGSLSAAGRNEVATRVLAGQDTPAGPEN
jgi:hypothetical protein